MISHVTVHSAVVSLSVVFSFWLQPTTSVFGEGLFPDSALDSAVRQEVFAKRNNLEPLTIEDVAKISRVVLKGQNANRKNIESLEGLQHCKSLMEIDLENNEIVDLLPIRDLKLLQKVTLAGNKITSLEPLAGLEAIQYLDVSRNQITQLDAIGSMRNLRSLYFETNQVHSLTPIVACKRLWSLYGGKNPLQDFSAISSLSNVDTLHLQETGFSDLNLLKGLHQLKNLQLQGNQVADLGPLVQMCEEDATGKKRFAAYLRVNLGKNPLKEASQSEQMDKLRKIGVRVSVDND